MKGFVVESQRNDFDSVFSDGMQTSCTLNIESAKTRAFSRRQTGSSLSYSIVCSFFNDAASGRAAFEVDATAVTLQSSCRN